MVKWSLPKTFKEKLTKSLGLLHQIASEMSRLNVMRGVRATRRNWHNVIDAGA